MAGEWRRDHSGKRVLISAYEHPSVREPAKKFCRATEVTELTLGEEAFAGGVGLVSWMMANNETGVIYDWQALTLRHVADGSGFGFHADAAQWIEKMPLDEIGSRAPATGSAHKFGGPRGVGFLRLSGDAAGVAHGFQSGGPQESGRRAGGEPAGVAAMLAALEHAQSQSPGDAGPRDKFEEQRPAGGRPGPSTPLEYEHGYRAAPRQQAVAGAAEPARVSMLDRKRLQQRQTCDSHVLAAMGLRPDELKRVLRFSSGWTTTADDGQSLAGVLHHPRGTRCPRAPPRRTRDRRPAAQPLPRPCCAGSLVAMPPRPNTAMFPSRITSRANSFRR